MTRKYKLIQKFLKRPESLTFSQIENVLIQVGFERVEAKGSHVKFKYLKSNIDLVIPVHGGECLSHYKRRALKIVLKYNLIKL